MARAADPVHRNRGSAVPKAERLVQIPAGDLETLIDRVVYAPNWTPDRLDDLDGHLLEVVGRCMAAWDAIE